MRNLILSPLAANDLDEIWDYTCDHWGWQQADVYVGNLRGLFIDLARGHRTGRPCDDVRRGYFRIGCGSHLVFYVSDRESLDIKRVLHASMDFQRHL